MRTVDLHQLCCGFCGILVGCIISPPLILGTHRLFEWVQGKAIPGFYLWRAERWRERQIRKRGKRMASKSDPHKESYYQSRIIKWLKDNYPGAFVWKAAAGPYSRQGLPDVCAIINGHFFGFEVKRPEVGRLSKIQEQTIKEINAAGGTALVVTYPAQVQEAIEHGDVKGPER